MTTSWLVRRATVQDAALLAELAAETFPLACPPGFDPDAIRLHIQRRLSADAFRINLADVAMEYTVALRTGDGAVGYLLLTEAPGPGAEELLELRQIYVRPRYQGSGLSDALMKVAVQRAQERGYAGVWLGTSKDNARAIAFYRRHNFRVRGERFFLVSDVPNEDWVMVRTTGSAPGSSQDFS